MSLQTFILVLGIFIRVNEAANPNILEALNTTERIYVYSTSQSIANNSCAYYRYYNISCPHYYCFYNVRYYSLDETGQKKKGQWHYGELQDPCRRANYTNNACLLRMDTSNFSVTQKVDEPERRVLMSWNKQAGCGVFVRLDRDKKVGCEVHVRHSTLKKNDSIYCDDDFKKYCEDDTRILQYTANCT
uniref:Lipocalin n=1 Tax=Rhipicephalus zambeziensis TaxID=60191 RepID=A0A224Y7Y0_9ACAR